MSIRLKGARIRRYRSLYDVELNFGRLTILVGPNASGKSNCLNALSFFQALTYATLPAPAALARELTYRNEDGSIDFFLEFEQDGRLANYELEIEVTHHYPKFTKERLNADGTGVIDIANGQGVVRDEIGDLEQPYSFRNLAIRAAGDFGSKPMTAGISAFIRGWKFLNLAPELMRGEGAAPEQLTLFSDELNKERDPTLDARGSFIQDLLVHLSKKQKSAFKYLNADLRGSLNLELQAVKEKRKTHLKVVEPGGIEIPVSQLSDGTWRMIAYYTLLHYPDLPPLLGIEEPESNLHPGILKDVAEVLKRLSKRTQIITSTHSSQLLDCFSLRDIEDETVSVILLRRREGKTEAHLLNELSHNNEALRGWMGDFGVGIMDPENWTVQSIKNGRTNKR